MYTWYFCNLCKTKTSSPRLYIRVVKSTYMYTIWKRKYNAVFTFDFNHVYIPKHRWAIAYTNLNYTVNRCRKVVQKKYTLITTCAYIHALFISLKTFAYSGCNLTKAILLIFEYENTQFPMCYRKTLGMICTA